jgi:hypothetical protein
VADTPAIVTCTECGGRCTYRAMPIDPGTDLARLLGRVTRMPFGFALRMPLVAEGVLCTRCGSGVAHVKVLARTIVLVQTLEVIQAQVDGKPVYTRRRRRVMPLPGRATQGGTAKH